LPIDLNKTKLNHNSYEPLPAGLTVKARFILQGGSYGEDGWLHQAPNGYAYLHGFFIIVNGHYAGHKVYQEIGVEVCAQPFHDPFIIEAWEGQGRSLLRAIIESAKGIDPEDMSESAQAARRLTSYAELNGLECGIVIGERKDFTQSLFPQNIIQEIITPDHRDYIAVMHYDEEIYNYPVGESTGMFVLREESFNVPTLPLLYL